MFELKKYVAKKLIDAMNEILKRKPIGKAEFDEKYEEMVEKLRMSEWRPVVAELNLRG